MRALSMLLGCSILAGCTTMQVDEKNFIRPDSETGIKLSQRFDAAALQSIVPDASLQGQSVAAEDSVVLQGILVRQQRALATVLYFGGNMFHLDEGAPELLPLLSACRLDVAMFDYRGYGRSPGQPNVATMKSDALRIYDQVRAQTGGKLIVHGQSLGSFIAAYVAQQRTVDGLVLESTASNALDWADANMPWFARPFVRIEVAPSLRGIDNVAAASQYAGISLLLTGEQDKITPPALARKVFDALPGQAKQFQLSPGGGHNGLMARSDTQPGYCAFVQRVAAH